MIIGGGENVRIKEIKGYQGNDTGFGRLYAAIWAKAVEDELRYQMTRLLMDTSGRLFGGLMKYDKNDRDTYAKISRSVGLEYGMRGMEIIEKLETLIEESALEKEVQAKIYREAEDWPKNSRKDAKFKKAYIKIRDDILDALQI